MADLTVRPSIKAVQVQYVLALLLGAAIAVYASSRADSRIYYALAIPGLLLLAAVRRHIHLSFTRLLVEGGRMKYESGMLSRSSRTMELAKVQDVRVDQSLGQRMWGTGNLSIETAGESSRITIENIDKPHAAAEQILAWAKPKGQQHLA